MIESTIPAPLGARWVWTGRIVSGFVVAFFLFSGGIKLAVMPEVDASMDELGYPMKFALLIGVLEVGSILLYAIPRTAVLGALLFTAILGGAISTHLRVESPLFSHTLFGVYMGVLMWGGLWLRDPRVRALLPIRSTRAVARQRAAGGSAVEVTSAGAAR